MRILVQGTKYPSDQSYSTDFIAVLKQGETLLEVMTRASAYNQMT